MIGVFDLPARTAAAVHAGHVPLFVLDLDVTNDFHPNFVHCPSETTSTEPSTTLMAVCSSIA